jgi:PAS domain S-box-containing protein
MDQRHEEPGSLKRYGLAVVLAGLALLARGMLPVMEGTTVYQLPLAAVILSAWLAGRGPGYLAATTCWLGIVYWFLPPEYGLTVDEKYVVGLSIFTALCVLLVEFGAGRRRVERALAASDRRSKSAEAELRARQELLDLAQKAARAVAFDWYIGARESENHWSPELEAIYGLEPGTFDGTYKSWRNLVHPDDWPTVKAAIDRANESGDIAAEYRVVRKDGTEHWLRAKGRMFFDAAGKPERMVGFMSDVTDWHIAEESLRAKDRALETARTELARVSRLTTLGELTASIAHEVNQPLGAMVANAGACARWLAAEPPGIAKARQVLESIASDGKRAGEVIARIRSLTKRKPSPAGRLDVNHKVAEALALVDHELRSNGIVLETRLDDALPAVEGDRVQLQQVLLNLVMNAIDAMSAVNDRPRQLTIVSARPDESAVRIDVYDSGVGLDAGSAEQVFEAFYTTKPEGLGIGLAISRSIIEAHGGRLWAEPNAPHGAVFRFSLPVARENAA